MLTEITNTTNLTSPSLLAANFTNLQEDINNLNNLQCPIVHLDIMDGHFVPNISFGPFIIKQIRPLTTAIFDTHLMLTNPDKYIEAFAKAGSDHITIHFESSCNILSCLNMIKKHNLTCGISIKPNTPIEKIFPYLTEIDLVLIMSVEPGFGGQKFQISSYEKIKLLKQEIIRQNLNVHIEVDGGVNEDNCTSLRECGANILVAGTAFFQHKKGVEYAYKKLNG